MLELVGLGSDPKAAAALATRLGGRAYENHPGEHEKRPYSAMFEVVTDDIEAVRAVADYGLYVVFRRQIKAPSGEPSPDRCIATFGMVGHPSMTHRQSDDHWRDTHGPLALRMHLAMCDYAQLSVVQTISGRELDGIAMCAFNNRDDLSKKFFNDDDAKAAILDDVSTFAHPTASPARVILNQIV